MEKRRRIFSILLLSVLLPALIASSVHIHPAAEAAGVDCYISAR